MLYRPGRLSYLAVISVFIYTWTHYHVRSREAIIHGWDITVQRFGQGSSFAEDSSSAPPTNVALTLLDESTATATHSFELTSTIRQTSWPAPQKTEITVEEIVEQPDPYAYVFYATQDLYACSVLVNIDRLQTTFNTTHRIFVLATEKVSELYITAFRQRNIIVSIYEAPQLADGASSNYYADCLLKLYGFRMHEIDPSLKRVVVLDSDQLILKNLDYLLEGFEGLDFDLASPHAYWLSKDTFSSAFLLINLSDRLWNKMKDAIETIKPDTADMDLVNQLLGNVVMLLPGHFVTLNSHWEDWNLPNWYHGPDTRNGTKPNDNKKMSKTTSVVTKTAATKDSNKKRQMTDLESVTEANAMGDAVNHKARPQRVAGNAELNINAAENAPSSHSPAVDDVVKLDTFSEPPSSPPLGLDSIVPAIEAPATTNGKLYDGGNRLLPAVAEVVDDVFNSRPAPSTLLPPPTEEASYSITYTEDMPKPVVVKPEDRPLYHELYDLVSEVSVLHFSALGKPWSYTVADVHTSRPGAHPVFAEQFKIWRETALNVCPEGYVNFV